MNRRLVVLLVALCHGAVACSSSAVVEPQAAATTEPVSEALTSGAIEDTVDDTPEPLPVDEARLQDLLDDWERDADGGAVVFVRNEDGSSVAAAAGIDPATDEPLQATDQVRVGSISKIFTTVLVLQMVDEGLVDLDAPVSTYVDGLALANDVTVRELLGHRSGIPNYTETRGFFEVVVANPERTPAPSDLIGYTNAESDFDPGTEFAYSNTNFVVAGLVVEAVRGESLNDALDNHIATELGLTRTRFADGTLSEVAGGYSAQTGSGSTFGQSYNSIAYGSWAAGALVTAVDELALFLDALFDGGLLTQESLTEMLNPIDDGAEYGLGIHPGPDFGVGHGGAITGFNSMAQFDRETREMVIVVVNNDQRSPSVLTAKLTNFLRQ